MNIVTNTRPSFTAARSGHTTAAVEGPSTLKMGSLDGENRQGRHGGRNTSLLLPLTVCDSRGVVLPVNAEEMVNECATVQDALRYLTQHVFPLDTRCHGLLLCRRRPRRETSGSRGGKDRDDRGKTVAASCIVDAPANASCANSRNKRTRPPSAIKVDRYPLSFTGGDEDDEARDEIGFSSDASSAGLAGSSRGTQPFLPFL